MALDLDALARALVESSPDYVVVFDADRRIRIVSDTTLELVNLSRDQAVGRRLTDLFDHSDYLGHARNTFEILDQVLAHVLATGVGHDDDDASRATRDLDVRPASVRLHPIRRDGEVVGATFTTRDLEMSGSLMFRRAAVGMAHVDRKGNLREANESLLELVGRERAEVQGQPFVRLVHPDDLDTGRSAIDDVLHGRAPDRQVELRLRRADGEERWALVSASSNHLGGEGVGGACVVVQDVTERVRLRDDLVAARERLQSLALHDSLTGLPNRTYLAHRLDDAQRAAARSGRHTAVLFVDLDGFKSVNDSVGHAAGDLLLVEVAERIASTLRPSDFAARFGGDEFVVACTNLSADPGDARAEAMAIAERICMALALPYTAGDHAWMLGASIGVAVSAAGDMTPDELLTAADADMYRAKASRSLG